MLRFAAKPHILFYALPWLMVLLFLGTIAQKNMGIYEVTQIYFNSWFLWVGPIPLPGGLMTLGAIFLTLTVKFIFFSQWSLNHAGIILTHFGVLLLLLGGLVTARFAHEGFMVIPEGETVANVSEYRERIFTLSRENEVIIEAPFSMSKGDYGLQEAPLPFELSIDYICDNCSMTFQEEELAERAHGLAQKVNLIKIPLEKEAETNLAGLGFSLKNVSQEADGYYILMESVSNTMTFEHDGESYTLTLGRAQNPLPFSITLQDFRKITYPGTAKAQGFESDIVINDNGVEWPMTIRMNEPARYKGYTFYQSSFVQHPNKEVTVLSVVQNIGHAFPYISCLIIFLGMALHTALKLKEPKRREA